MEPGGAVPRAFSLARPAARRNTAAKPRGFASRTAKQHQLQADRNLSVIEKAAKDAGVPCETLCEIGDHPYETIIRVAEKRGCDLIMMASHGRRGVKGLLIGSETHKVLTHSRIPVLVHR